MQPGHQHCERYHRSRGGRHGFNLTGSVIGNFVNAGALNATAGWIRGALTNNNVVSLANGAALTVGSYAQNSSAELNLNTGSSFADTNVKLSSNGIATLAGTLKLTVNFAGANGETLVLVQSAGLSGTSFNATNVDRTVGPAPSALNHWNIEYTPDAVLAVFIGALTSFSGLTPNETAIANALDIIFLNGGLPAVQSALTDLSGAQLAMALSKPSSEAYADYGTQTLENSAMFANAIFAALQSAVGNEPVRADPAHPARRQRALAPRRGGNCAMGCSG
jgi:hypothetical protein